MHSITILLFLFAINTLWAADAKEIDILDLSPENADIDLKVIDIDRKIHKFSLHSKVLKKSRYFRINFGLDNLETKTTPLKKTYNVSSKYVFEQIIAFFYEKSVSINNFNEFFELLLIQEQLEIEELDEYLYEIINEEKFLEILQEQELINILLFMYRSQRPSANLNFTRILAFIGSNNNICKFCIRKKILLFPKISGDLKQKVEDALSASKRQEPGLPEKIPSTNQVSKKHKRIF